MGWVDAGCTDVGSAVELGPTGSGGGCSAAQRANKQPGIAINVNDHWASVWPEIILYYSYKPDTNQ